jgi:hypothetical protein
MLWTNHNRHWGGPVDPSHPGSRGEYRMLETRALPQAPPAHEH